MSTDSFPNDTDIDACLLADRGGYRRRLVGLKHRAKRGKPFQAGLNRLLRDIESSRNRAGRRRDLCPKVHIPSDLPIYERLSDIKDLIRTHQVVVLCGETGSGKSTQLPKICLALGFGVFGRIGHTQPRRIAARSLSARISAELGREPGTSVGYKIRFNDRVGPDTPVKLMTDGILLAEIQRDPDLLEYEALIIDEAHERSLNIDFLLGYLKNLLPRRPDLKLIVTSATIDPVRFSRHFGDAPVIEISGRTYPVEVCYRPPEEGVQGERDDGFQKALVDAVDELSGLGPGDILVFLSGEREIRDTAETLRKHRMSGTEVLPLYARLTGSDQARIFQSHKGRRIILATNVAETSLTVPGIRYVIDGGYARISRYGHRGGIQRLPVEPVSRASAEQRKGRCGRLGPGVCVRLFDQAGFDSWREFTEPEILRTNLAAVILQMKVLGFGDISEFPFIDPPDKRLVNDGYRVLEEIGAIGRDRRVTRLGRQIARLPLDPRIGKMLLSAARHDCLSEILVIAAALSIQDPRERPLDKQQYADEKHFPFRNEESDFLGYLSLWGFLEDKRRHLSKRKFRALCRDHFLSWSRVQEWHDVHRQIRAQMHDMGFRDNATEATYESVHAAVLAGLLSNIGFRHKGREYQGIRGAYFYIHPGSGLFDKAPKWILAAELVETTKLYARGVARIKSEWVEAAAGHLLQHSYSEPHWEKHRGQVAAYDRISLFGLTLIPRRKVNYGPINPSEARAIFIRSALVQRDFSTRAPFFRHNRELIDTVWNLESKARKRDILVDEEAIYEFYDKRVPHEVFNTYDFEKWLRGIRQSQPKLLHMRLSDLMARTAEDIDSDRFPDFIEFQGTPLPLRYQFDPGQNSDGVTLDIPIAMINQVSRERCDWLVPGMLREKILALIRGLPKPLRKAFVPVPEHADNFLMTITPGAENQPLIRVLADELERMTGVRVPENAWPNEQLPEHLTMNFRVLDDKGRAIATGRDLESLKQRFSVQAQEGLRQSSSSDAGGGGSTKWDFGTLSQIVQLERSGVKMRGFPALTDEGSSVSVRIMDSEERARQTTRRGLQRLFALQIEPEIRYLRKNLPDIERIRLQYTKVPDRESDEDSSASLDITGDLFDLIVDLSFIDDRPEIRDENSFEVRLKECRKNLVKTANQVGGLVSAVLTQYRQLRKRLATTNQVNWKPSVEDMKRHLDRLIFRGFLLETPYSVLRHFPRYLSALELRLDKLEYAAARDADRMKELRSLEKRWEARDRRNREQQRVDERLEEIRWALEELRVSFFAQELKTAYPVSVKRIERRWRELGL